MIFCRWGSSIASGDASGETGIPLTVTVFGGAIGIVAGTGIEIVMRDRAIVPIVVRMAIRLVRQLREPTTMLMTPTAVRMPGRAHWDGGK